MTTWAQEHSDYGEPPEYPSLKLYAKDLSDIKNIDVDDTCTLILKVKAASKYHEEYMEDAPLCITFDVLNVKKENKKAGKVKSLMGY